MSVAIITGSSGLIGSEATSFFCELGHHVVGIDNDMRAYFFGADASTRWNERRLRSRHENFESIDLDIRDRAGVERVFSRFGRAISVVIHAAAQPSHDWAANEPLTDFGVNATGTINLLEATRLHSPEAAFVLLSTNKVYGDAPNELPLVELATRWEVEPSHPFAAHGIDESLRVDQSTHSLFGASKLAADIMTQEYGRYFGLRTGIFRGGCLTGPQHSGAELHGFLAYLARCIVTGTPYTVFGHRGKQVRDNIHAHDMVSALWHFAQDPQAGRVYNMGGSRMSNCSMLEAISLLEDLAGRELEYTIGDQPRAGDHIWYISDVRRFAADYPGWRYRYSLREMAEEIVAAALERYAVRS